MPSVFCPRCCPTFTAILVLMVCACTARAELKLAALYSDHAVLQADAQVPVWGWAEAGQRVAVRCGAGDEVVATAGVDRRWIVRLPPMRASATPIELTVPKFWYRFASFALSGDGDSFVAFFDIAQVPTDACKWEQSKTAIGPTVQDLVTALTTQQNTVATTPEPRDLDGHPGVYLEVRQPVGLDLQNCDLQYAVGWFDRVGNEVPTVGSDGFNAIWAVDLGDGQRVVITWGSYQPLSDKQRAVVQSIVDSLTIP